MFIAKIVDTVCAKVARKTSCFVQTKVGKLFLSIVLVGPLTFIPTVYEAWTAPNIDAFRTLTWPLMILVNSAGWLAVIHNGDWRMRLAMFFWIVSMVAVWLATIVR